MKKTNVKTRNRKNRRSSPPLKPQDPLPGLMSLAGKFKVKDPFDPAKAREYMEKNYERV